MTLSKEELIGLYRRRAKNYDITANLYYAIGFREWAYRKQAVEALALRPGDTIVEIGCGTGLNFSLIQKHISHGGKLIGVDMTDAMLEQARKRVERERWENVELVHCDAASYEFAPKVDGVISTFAITLIPEYDEIIRKGSEALVLGRKFAVLDFKMPSNWLSSLAPILEPLIKPFGATIDLSDRHPWESIERYLKNVSVKDIWGGFIYLAVGGKGDQNPNTH